MEALWTVLFAIAWLGTTIALVIVIAKARRREDEVLLAMRELDSAKRSQATRYGQITEQFAPMLQDWPWDPKRFRFIGTPIDGIQFTDDGIVFVEIKTATSKLSTVQRQVRDMVQMGRVAWHEQRIGEDRP